MSTLNTTVKLKRSDTPGAQPSSLEAGEVALNNNDGILYYAKPDTVLGAFLSTDQLNLNYLRLDGTTLPTANIRLGSYNIQDLADPVNNQDAVTKSYVDTSLADLGLSTFPTGDYGLVSETLNTDAFGIALYSAYDCLTTPEEIIQTNDLGVLT
jgi:hypothetical protein